MKFSILSGGSFRFLNFIGSLLTIAGLVVAAVYAVAAVVSLFPSEGMAINTGILPSLIMFAWSGALIVIGQIFHWLVAMKASQDQIISLLRELKDSSQVEQA